MGTFLCVERGSTGGGGWLTGERWGHNREGRGFGGAVVVVATCRQVAP
jgi:hypothetical protein